MFFADGPIGSNQRRLDVAERGVDPFEGRGFRGFLAGAGDDRRMLAAGVRHRGETFQAVGDDLCAALQRRAGELAQRRC